MAPTRARQSQSQSGLRWALPLLLLLLAMLPVSSATEFQGGPIRLLPDQTQIEVSPGVSAAVRVGVQWVDPPDNAEHVVYLSWNVVDNRSRVPAAERFNNVSIEPDEVTLLPPRTTFANVTVRFSSSEGRFDFFVNARETHEGSTYDASETLQITSATRRASVIPSTVAVVALAAATAIIARVRRE